MILNPQKISPRYIYPSPSIFPPTKKHAEDQRKFCHTESQPTLQTSNFKLLLLYAHDPDPQTRSSIYLTTRGISGPPGQDTRIRYEEAEASKQA